MTAGLALDMDLESIRSRTVSIDMADRFFSSLESGDLAWTPSPRRQYRFFEHGTLNEAYIKAYGMGLQLPLDILIFNCPDDRRVELAIDRELGVDPASLRFRQLQPEADFLLATCAERSDAQAPELVMRRAMPLAGEKSLPSRSRGLQNRSLKRRSKIADVRRK